MPTKVEVQARNLRLTERIRTYVEKKAAKLDHYLSLIEDAHVELTHHGSARSAKDRNVAQVTVRGKGLLLRTEERADEILAAFDAAIDKLHRQIDRYKGKHYHGRGPGHPAVKGMPKGSRLTDKARGPSPLIVRRKQFLVLPMNELEAIEQMRLLGHDNFFIFYNPETSRINILYRRRDGSYGLIEPEIG